MRVLPQALASIAALSFFASCVTPPPLAPRGEAYSRYDAAPPSRDIRPASYRADPGPPPRSSQEYDPRGYDDPAPYEGSQYGRYGNDWERGRGTHESYDPGPSGRLSVLLGRRNLEEDDFEPTDEPGILGLEFSQVPAPGSLGFEFGLAFGYDEDDGVSVPGVGTADLELAQAEIYAGVRTEFGHGNVRPYIGGGGTFMSTTTKVTQGFSEAEEDDGTFGFYLHGGIQADINRTFFIGVDYRHVFGSDYEVNGSDFDSDYDQLAIVLGFNL